MRWVRFFLRERRSWGTRVALHNLRFEVAYALGRFTFAHRCDGECDATSCPVERF